MMATSGKTWLTLYLKHSNSFDFTAFLIFPFTLKIGRQTSVRRYSINFSKSREPFSATEIILTSALFSIRSVFFAFSTVSSFGGRDVLIKREDNGKLETSVYRKQTHTDIYLNWNAHAPTTWKVATAKSLVKRAFRISSTKKSLDEELAHLTKVFTTINNYPKKIIQNIIETEQREITEIQEVENNETITLSLPYAGKQGEHILRKLKRSLDSHMKDHKINIIYNTKKLSSCFPIKDKTALKHNNNIVYHAQCPEPGCKANYTGQTKCRLEKRVIEHNKQDKNSHLLKHSIKENHHRVWLNDFKVIGKNYKSNFKRKISESLFIKETNPSLNVQKDAYKLSLY